MPLLAIPVANQSFGERPELNTYDVGVAAFDALAKANERLQRLCPASTALLGNGDPSLFRILLRQAA